MKRRTKEEVVKEMRHKRAKQLWEDRLTRKFLHDPETLNGVMDLRDDEPAQLLWQDDIEAV